MLSRFTSGIVMKRQPQQINGTLCSSMFRSRCFGPMSCAAIALSVKHPNTLPEMDLVIEITSVKEITVNAWICVGSGRKIAFIRGATPRGVAVPATAPGVISVSGIDQSGKLWPASSIGPAALYDIPLGIRRPVFSPKMAHLIENAALPGEGTSFSAPYAAADLAEFLIGAGKGWTGNTSDDLTKDFLTYHKSFNGIWNNATGYGALAH